MSDLIIEHALVIPMGPEPVVLPDHHVVISGGLITRVGPGPAPVAAVAGGARRIDARGRVVMPGLINAHTHCWQVLTRGIFEDQPLIPWLRRIYGTGAILTEEEYRVGGTLAGLEMIRCGVTGLCEHHFANPSVDHTAATTEGILASGLRLVLARTIMDEGEIVPLSLREDHAAAFRATEDLMARFKGVDDSKLRWMTGPNTPPVSSSPKLCRACREFADHHHMGISSHIAEGCAVVEMVRRNYGAGGVVEMVHRLGLTGEKTIFAHVVHLSPYEIQLLAESKTSVSHNPVSNMMLGDGVSPIVDMLKAGVNVGLGTDGASSNHRQDMFEVMKAASLLQRVHRLDPNIIQPYQVLRMATAGSARAIGMHDLCGEIRPGLRGDLIIVDLHNRPWNVAIPNLFSQLVHVTHGDDVSYTIVGGKVLMEEGRITVLDEPAVLSEARSVAERCISRLNKIAWD